jgi:hypothetical protein
MAAAGQNFTETIVVAASPEAASQALISATGGAPGYTVTTAGMGSIVLMRRYTPTWAIVVAVLGVIFALLGLLALLYKNTETLTVTLVAQAAGTRITVSGVASREMLERMAAALNALPRAESTGQSSLTTGSEAADAKVCPSCAETVRAAAAICRYCRYEFKESSTPSLAPAS